MPKEGSVAPKERVNIVYKPAVDGAEEVELPLKVLALGDYTGRIDDRQLEDRKPINIDKDNFEEVMEKHELSINITVPDRLDEAESNSEPGRQPGEMSTTLTFKRMKDFTPEGVLQQIPELQRLMELRDALTALKSPMGNVPTFRKKLQTMLENPDQRNALMAELGLGQRQEANTSSED